MMDAGKTMYGVARDWREEAFRIIYGDFAKKKIGVSGFLQSSLLIHILGNSEDDITRIQFMFAYYGRFLDMGVGRDFPIGSRGEIGLTKFLEKRNALGQLIKHPARKPKKFYTKTIMHEGHRLHELLVRQFGIKMVTMLEEMLPSGTINYII